MARFQGLHPSNISRFLQITLWDAKYPVSEQALHQVFHSFGALTVRFCTSTTAVVSFPTMSQAARAGLKMQGCCIYHNCCWMQIQFAREPTPATDKARQASRAPVCTPVVASLSVSISVASAAATPAAVCVRASPAPAPSALTAADEKPVRESWVDLQDKLDNILAKLAPRDDHDAAATSSPSTTTTPPQTAPGPAPSTPNEALTSTELVGDRPLQPPVVPEIAMSTPARCSTECQDAKLAPLDNTAASSLPSTTTTAPPTAPQRAPPSATTTAAVTTTAPPTTALAPVAARPEEALANIELGMDRPLQLSVLPEPVMLAPATCSIECRAIVPKQCDVTCGSLAGTNILPAGIWSGRVPPRPPDRRCTSPGQGLSLPPSVPMSVSHKEPNCSWLRPVPVRPPDQCKPGELQVPSHPAVQNRGTTFASGPVTLASESRYVRGGFSEVLVERVSVVGLYLAMIVAYLQYAEIRKRHASCGGLLDANHYKLNDMVSCWNVGLLVMLPREIVDMNGLESRIRTSEFSSLLSTHLGCHLHGYTTDISYTSAFSVPCLSVYGLLQFRKLQVAMIWDPGIKNCFMGVSYYPGNTIGVRTSACRATVVQQYTNSDHLQSLASDITHNCTTSSLVQLANLIDGSHQKAVEVGPNTSKNQFSLELHVMPKVEMNGVTILWVELHFYSTYGWLSFPWKPGVHTWLACCCRIHDSRVPPAVYGSEFLDLSYVCSSWQVKAWTNVFLYITYHAEAMKQIKATSKEATSYGNSGFSQGKLELSNQGDIHQLEMVLSRFTTSSTSADLPWIIAWSPSLRCSVFDFTNKHLLLPSSVVHPTKTAAVTFEWPTTCHLQLVGTMPHWIYQLSQFASMNLLELKALPARPEFSWLEFANQRVFFGADCKSEDSSLYQLLHLVIYRQAMDWSLPWDPGGNSPSAWGQADSQGGSMSCTRSMT